MELIKPDIGLIFWLFIAFLLVLFILRKYAWGPILNGLNARQKSIDEALKSADKAKEEMNKLKYSGSRRSTGFSLEAPFFVYGTLKKPRAFFYNMLPAFLFFTSQPCYPRYGKHISDTLTL